MQDLGEGRFRVGLVRFDSKSRLITVPATMHMREGPVEYVLVTSQGKIHEAVFTSPINPRDLHVAALLLGMKPQPDLGPDRAAAKAGEPGALKAWVEWDRNGPPAKLPLHEVVAVANPSAAAVAGTLAAGAWL
ncbi:MAG: hypothetical protein HKO57_08530, partial [Akkermansiaceae bacterium]|nr:hypothetical protein [Akkermansiaceae bacterium]